MIPELIRVECRELADLMKRRPEGLTGLYCHPDTFPYYIEAMKALGVEPETADLAKVKSDIPRAIPVGTGDMLEKGYLYAGDRDGNVICVYRVPTVAH